jgi:proteasome lid subunit RPN8/RPN11
MNFVLSPVALAAAQTHALAEFPKESCGLIVDGLYEPCVNIASDPLNDFAIAGFAQVLITSSGREIEAIVHSHPNGQRYPSNVDMRGQISSAKPWVIIATDGADCYTPTIWGDQLPIPELIGRPFMHGVTDCFSLIRDAFRLGKPGLALIDCKEWPFDPVVFDDVPRSDGWWDEKDGEQLDLYADGMKLNGFKPISRDEVRAGDGFLMAIKSKTLNHAGLYLGDNLILHHLPGRLSRREPAGLWARAADLWVRWEPTS